MKIAKYSLCILHGHIKSLVCSLITSPGWCPRRNSIGTYIILIAENVGVSFCPVYRIGFPTGLIIVKNVCDRAILKYTCFFFNWTELPEMIKGFSKVEGLMK